MMTRWTRLSAMVSAIALSACCAAACSSPESEPSDSVSLALLEVCHTVDASDARQMVTSPGQVILDDAGLQVVQAPAEVVRGPQDALVGVGIAIDGVTAGDSGVALDDTMDLEFAPLEIEGPGTWPLVIVYRRSEVAEIVISELGGDPTFTLEVDDDCLEAPNEG